MRLGLVHLRRHHEFHPPLCSPPFGVVLQALIPITMDEDAKATMGLQPMQTNHAGDVEEMSGFGVDVQGAQGTQRGLKSRHAQMIALGGYDRNRPFCRFRPGSSDGRAMLSPRCIPSHELSCLQHHHGNHRIQLLPASSRQQCQLLWVALCLEQPGVRAGLDVLVHLCHHRSGRDHSNQPCYSILEPTCQCCRVDHNLNGRYHRHQLLPSQGLWRG